LNFSHHICSGFNYTFITSFQHYTDHQLVDLLQQDNRQAFDEIYQRYWSPLYAYSYNRLRSQPASEEIVQEVFLNLWTKRNTSKPIISLSAYLFTGVKYRMLNELKAKQVRKKFAASFDAFQITTYSTITQETLAYSDLQLALETTVSQLPPKCRHIFQLSRQEHLSISDISSVLHISPKTVENQLTKALKYLRLELKEFFFYLVVFLNW
jgi:RNA polymerase sigma-70 factor (ECF subfamily)